MTSINGIGGNSPVQKVIQNPIQKEIPIESATPSRTDKLELTGISHLLESLKSNEIRTEKVQQIRAEIAAGTYDSDDKLTAAADKLLDDLLK